MGPGGPLHIRTGSSSSAGYVGEQPLSPLSARFGHTQQDTRLRTTSTTTNGSQKALHKAVGSMQKNDSPWLIESDPFASYRNTPHSSTSHIPGHNIMPPPTMSMSMSVPSTTLKPHKKNRTSFLASASDILGFGFAKRRKPPIRPLPPIDDPLGEVLEISARRPSDDEETERERLREEAAQAVGLTSSLVITPEQHQPLPVGAEPDFLVIGPGDQDDAEVRSLSTAHQHSHFDARNAAAAREMFASNDRGRPVSIRSARSSIISNSIATAVGLGRETASQNIRSHPVVSTTPSPTPPGAVIPPFPSTPQLLRPLIQTSSILLKFCPSQSPLLILNRSRQWKIRHMAFTSFKPEGVVVESSKSYIHLFKTGGEHEQELERLQINQDSVVYVVDEEVGAGRKFVLKVGGVAGKVRPGVPMTMWLLQLPDSVQMQRWIQYIKTAILIQRAERAGLNKFYPNAFANSNGPELRGDMDVMLSLGKQGLLSPPLLPTITIPTTYDLYPNPASPTSTITNYDQGTTSSATTKTSSSLSNASFSNNPAPFSPTASQTNRPSTAVSTTVAAAAKSGNSSRPATAQSHTGSISAAPASAAVHALKGLFNSSRPIARSISISTNSSTGSTRPTSAAGRPGSSMGNGRPTSPEQQMEEDSLGNRATALFNRLRSSTTVSSPTASPVFPPPMGKNGMFAMADEKDDLQSLLDAALPGPPVTQSVNTLAPQPLSIQTPLQHIQLPPLQTSLNRPKLHHSHSFSVDWEGIDGSAAAAAEKHRSLGSLSLAPPPRSRRAMTAGSLPISAALALANLGVANIDGANAGGQLGSGGLYLNSVNGVRPDLSSAPHRFSVISEDPQPHHSRSELDLIQPSGPSDAPSPQLHSAIAGPQSSPLALSARMSTSSLPMPVSFPERPGLVSNNSVAFGVAPGSASFGIAPSSLSFGTGSPMMRPRSRSSLSSYASDRGQGSFISDRAVGGTGLGGTSDSGHGSQPHESRRRSRSGPQPPPLSPAPSGPLPLPPTAVIPPSTTHRGPSPIMEDQPLLLSVSGLEHRRSVSSLDHEQSQTHSGGSPSAHAQVNGSPSLTGSSSMSHAAAVTPPFPSAHPTTGHPNPPGVFGYPSALLTPPTVTPPLGTVNMSPPMYTSGFSPPNHSKRISTSSSRSVLSNNSGSTTQSRSGTSFMVGRIAGSTGSSSHSNGGGASARSSMMPPQRPSPNFAPPPPPDQVAVGSRGSSSNEFNREFGPRPSAEFGARAHVATPSPVRSEFSIRSGAGTVEFGIRPAGGPLRSTGSLEFGSRSPGTIQGDPTVRSARLSLPPGPPPHVALPPRPDEAGYAVWSGATGSSTSLHRMHQTNGGGSGDGMYWSGSTPTSALYSIPGSPRNQVSGTPLPGGVRPTLSMSPPVMPGPAPTMPLPPTPEISDLPSPSTSASNSPRKPSLRLRLKMMGGSNVLSLNTTPAPRIQETSGPSSPVSVSSNMATPGVLQHGNGRDVPFFGLNGLGYTPPASPIGERIAIFDKEYSLNPGAGPVKPPPRSAARPGGSGASISRNGSIVIASPPQPNRLPLERISLSPPPPRRNSRASREIRATTPDREKNPEPFAPRSSTASEPFTSLKALTEQDTADVLGRGSVDLTPPPPRRFVARGSVADSLIDPMRDDEDEDVPPLPTTYVGGYAPDPSEIGIAISPRDSLVALTPTHPAP